MTTQKKPIVRRDATGHLDPEYQRKLLESSEENRSRDHEGRAFIDAAATEELSEELGEAFVQAATSGGSDAEMERRESVTPEETGGPFVPSTAGQEFAGGTDESNIPEATREPLPTTSREDD